MRLGVANAFNCLDPTTGLVHLRLGWFITNHPREREVSKWQKSRHHLTCLWCAQASFT
jgi:hypothetical protein